MNWGELKTQIIDLGFEDDSVLQEYSLIFISSCNRAIDIINNTVVARAEQYFKNIHKVKHGNDIDYVEWNLPLIEPITKDTLDNFIINLPSKVIELVPLLAAHYTWLDDDIAKASYYWNEYDDLKGQILDECLRPRGAKIRSDIRWGV